MIKTTAIRLCLGAALLVTTAATTIATTGQTNAPLRVVNVTAPAINCVFNKACKIKVEDSISPIAIPGISGEARLQSRWFEGAAGAPAAGMTGYLYRVDLTAASGQAACVSGIKLDFGLVTPLDYDSDGTPDGVYVITSGGLGTIGVKSAERAGTFVTFTFEKTICIGAAPSKDATSFFFGLTGAAKPYQRDAMVIMTDGNNIGVLSRVPSR